MLMPRILGLWHIICTVHTLEGFCLRHLKHACQVHVTWDHVLQSADSALTLSCYSQLCSVPLSLINVVYNRTPMSNYVVRVEDSIATNHWHVLHGALVYTSGYALVYTALLTSSS
jgi:hypothetical protein